MVAPLDMWDLFVNNVFGGFWIAVIALGVVIFVIMAMFGRMSIFSVQIYLTMFLLAMTLGYKYVIINTLITLSLIIALIFSWKSYIESKG